MPADQLRELVVDLAELRPGELVHACGRRVALTDCEGVSVVAESIAAAQAVLDEVSGLYAATRIPAAAEPHRTRTAADRFEALERR